MKTNNKLKKFGLLTIKLAIVGMLLNYSSSAFADTLSGSNVLLVKVQSTQLFFIYNGRAGDGTYCSYGSDFNSDGTYDSGFSISAGNSHYKEMVALILASYTMKIPLGFTYTPAVRADCDVSDVLF